MGGDSPASSSAATAVLLRRPSSSAEAEPSTLQHRAPLSPSAAVGAPPSPHDGSALPTPGTARAADEAAADMLPAPPGRRRRLVHVRRGQAAGDAAAGSGLLDCAGDRGIAAPSVFSVGAFSCSYGGSSSSTADASAATAALQRDFLAFHDRQEDAFGDLILQLADGHAVLTSGAILEARLPALLSVAEHLGEADPALLLVEGDRGRRGRVVQQARVEGLSRATVEALLRWAFGELVPNVEKAFDHSAGPSARALGPCAAGTALQDVFDVLEACNRFDLERLGALLRGALLEALDVEHFAVVLRESHVRRIPGLKQGCMRFALHHFDELIERPEVFVSPLQELPEVVSDLFRLSRRWKDEVSDGRERERNGRERTSPRPAPAPPSTFVSDMARLYEVARLEEERGKPEAVDAGHIEDEGMSEGRGRDRERRQDLAPDCRLRVGEDIYLAHAAVLAARSEFFFAAFASDMSEAASKTVTLQHVRGDMPRRESVLALLYFLYTGRTSKVDERNAMEVLALVGGEHGDGCASNSGYLQLHDAGSLRQACEAAAEGACVSGGFLELLVQAHGLGATRLKQRALHLAIHHFKDLALTGAFESLPPPLLSEVLRAVAVEFDPVLPSAAKGRRWELSLQPAPDHRLENTYEAVTSHDLSLGAGASSSAGCSEASLVATFDRPVRVRRIRVGVDLTSGDFDAARLNGSKLQFFGPGGVWLDAGVSVTVESDLLDMVREMELPTVVTARAFRLVRRHRLAVGLLIFE